MGAQLLEEDRLGERAEHEAVVGGDDVHGAALHDETNDLAVEEQALQLAWTEVDEARPQGDVRVAGVLALHPDEVVDDVERRTANTGEEVLAVQRRPVELAGGQQISGHRPRDDRFGRDGNEYW